MFEDMMKLFVQPVMNVWTVFASYIPNIVAALLFVLFGLFLARVLRSVFEQFFRKIKLDRHTSRIGINNCIPSPKIAGFSLPCFMSGTL